MGNWGCNPTYIGYFTTFITGSGAHLVFSPRILIPFKIGLSTIRQTTIGGIQQKSLGEASPTTLEIY